MCLSVCMCCVAVSEQYSCRMDVVILILLNGDSDFLFFFQFRMFTVPFDAESGAEKLFLCWPSLLVHTIDQHSPLWPISKDKLTNNLYELIVIMDGVAATTSKPFQVRKEKMQKYL